MKEWIKTGAKKCVDHSPVAAVTACMAEKISWRAPGCSRLSLVQREARWAYLCGLVVWSGRPVERGGLVPAC